MIKNIVFDMGQVLLKFDTEFFIRKVGVDDPGDIRILQKELYHSIEWAALDHGTMSLAAAEDSIRSRLPERLRPFVELLISKWERPILPVEGMPELLSELHQKGYKLYLLSNANIKQPEYWQKTPGHEFFEACMISAFEKKIKPQPEIFKLFEERFRINSAESVFIDDSPVNCEAACLCGFHGVVFYGDAAELRRKLVGLGVTISL